MAFLLSCGPYLRGVAAQRHFLAHCHHPRVQLSARGVDGGTGFFFRHAARSIWHGASLTMLRSLARRIHRGKLKVRPATSADDSIHGLAERPLAGVDISISAKRSAAQSLGEGVRCAQPAPSWAKLSAASGQFDVDRLARLGAH